MPDGLSGEEQAIYFSKIRGFFDSYACSRVMGRGKKMGEHLPDTNVGNIEYISKQDVVDYCKALMNAEVVQNTDDWGYGKERYSQTEVILEFIEKRQPADVAQVVHGYWINEYWHGGKVRKCSVCHITQTVNVYEGKVKFNHCPYCGAKMDGERREE